VLARRGLLHEDTREGGEGGFHWIADAYPAQGVPLRGFSDENFAVVETKTGNVLAEVDYDDAAAQLHVNAIYPLEGRLYQVDKLDWDAHKAFVRAVDVDYTTEAMTYKRVAVLETLAEASEGRAGAGEVHVVEKVVGFKKIRLHTHENVGYGEIALPDKEKHTRGLWLDFVQPLDAGADELIVMSEARDLGPAVGEPETERHGGAALPRVFLYDAITGGAGLSERLYERRVELVERAARLVRACVCVSGCPACVGAPAQHIAASGPAGRPGTLPVLKDPRVQANAASHAKAAAIVLLETLARRLAS
jgi:DEAD/DEAH box helicase domain-containing protein